LSIIDRQLRAIDAADNVLLRLEKAQIDRVNAAMAASFQRLTKQLSAALPARSGSALLSRDRAILLANDLRDSLNILSPNDPAVRRLLQDFNALNLSAITTGQQMADDVLKPLNMSITNTADLSLDAVAVVAKDGYDRLLGHGQTFAQNGSVLIQESIMQGWGTGKTTNAFRSILNVTRASAERIIRTETARAFTGATKDRYRQFDISEVIWVATQDRRCCPRCAARAGNVYKIDETVLPLHPSDRCRLLPYRKDLADAGLIDTDWLKSHSEDSIARAGGSDSSPSKWEINGAPKAIRI
jgi:SPP1 gp7 family putative phage head morphogenesis protein